jgi:hypothetical protein
MEPQVISNNEILLDVALFRNKISKHNFIFTYRGTMSHTIVKNVLALTEKKIDAMNEDGNIKKKIFGVMINCLQTICSPQKKMSTIEESLFMIDKSKSGYTIYTGVTISTDSSLHLINSIDHINNLSNQLLSGYRKEKLLDFKQIETSFDLNEVVLGLVNIAKKSGEKITYNAEQLDNDRSFFTLQIEIN